MKGLKIKSSFSMKPKVATEEQQNLKLKQAAKMYEKQFLGEMMKAMRSTVSHSEFSKPGFAEKIYRNQLDDKYTDQWGENGGIGLSELIYEQIKERFGVKTDINQPKGPIPIKKGPQFLEKQMKNNMIKINKNEKDLSFVLPVGKENGQPVTSPWDGQVKNTYASKMNQVIEIQHDIGLSSLLTFSGNMANELKNGDSVKAGDMLGKLNNIKDHFYWKLS